MNIEKSASKDNALSKNEKLLDKAIYKNISRGKGGSFTVSLTRFVDGTYLSRVYNKVGFSRTLTVDEAMRIDWTSNFYGYKYTYSAKGNLEGRSVDHGNPDVDSDFLYELLFNQPNSLE